MSCSKCDLPRIRVEKIAVVGQLFVFINFFCVYRSDQRVELFFLFRTAGEDNDLMHGARKQE